MGSDANEKSFGSADFWVEMGENLFSLISQHPILCDKHHNNYHDNQVEDNMWLEIQEDEDVGYFCVFFWPWLSAHTCSGLRKPAPG